MSEISEQIERIIAKRKNERLPQIEKEINFLTRVKSAIHDLDELINTVTYQNETKQGLYYTMLQTDPSMESRFMAVSTAEVKRLVDEQLDKLENLQKRFDRDAVQIAFVGYERQGKSCFLQSISGLSNKVIPAYSGTSCTGAVSVIHNVDKDLEVHIEFYELDTFLGIVREKLERFFPGRRFVLNNISDIDSLDFSSFDRIKDPNLTLEFDKFLDAYVEKKHRCEFENLIGHAGIDTSDENEVIQHVSQYERFDTIPEGDDPELYSRKKTKDENNNEIYVWQKNYYKYIAVKSVNIKTRFVDPRIGDSKIVLVDTIGMGDASNAERIENEMFRVLREDCDAAVDVFMPKSGGDSLNTKQTGVLKKIGRRLSERNPERWLYYVLNRVESVRGYNVEVIQDIKRDALKCKDALHVADVIDINALDTEEVNQRLISPLLDLITNNLDDIDLNLVAEANKSNELLYQEYKLLADAVAKVVSSSMKAGSNELKKFRELYKDDLTYSKELKKLDNRYYQEKDKPCDVVKDNIDNVISKLTSLIDTPNVIVADVVAGRRATNDILEKYCTIFRNRIYAAFRDVNTNVLLPLQNQLKDSLVQILFENARLGRIPLQNYAVEDGPSQLWLNTFINEKVDKDAYPYMYHMFNFILDYEISIEGLMEYNVARCLDTLDKHSSSFKTMSPLQGMTDAQQAKKIWSEIVSRTSLIQIEMRKWRDDFSLIPSHSFYARISMFRDLIVDDTDTNISEELYNFYSENRMAIWRDQFVGLMKEEEAFGKWNGESAAITDLCKKNSFLIDIKDY